MFVYTVCTIELVFVTFINSHLLQHVCTHVILVSYMYDELYISYVVYLLSLSIVLQVLQCFCYLYCSCIQYCGTL